MALTVLQSTAQMQRKTRRPTHPFQVRHLPFQIQPFLIAPVLPGETMEFGNLQSRCVVDPIKSPFVGWWLEHYVFYVPHLSMPGAADWERMVLEPDFVSPDSSAPTPPP